MSLSEEELQRLKDEAGGYYLGVWNLLQKQEAPPNLMVDAAINNMLCMMDRYLAPAQKLELLEIILTQIKSEESSAPIMNQ